MLFLGVCIYIGYKTEVIKIHEQYIQRDSRQKTWLDLQRLGPLTDPFIALSGDLFPPFNPSLSIRKTQQLSLASSSLLASVSSSFSVASLGSRFLFFFFLMYYALLLFSKIFCSVSNTVQRYNIFKKSKRSILSCFGHHSRLL